MRQLKLIGVVAFVLILTAGVAMGQGRFEQPPDIPMRTYGYGPYGYAPYTYGPSGSAFAPARPWNPSMQYDPSTGLWYPPGGGIGRRYDRSAVRVFDPMLGGHVYVPEDVYESGIWNDETPRFGF